MSIRSLALSLAFLAAGCSNQPGEPMTPTTTVSTPPGIVAPASPVSANAPSADNDVPASSASTAGTAAPLAPVDAGVSSAPETDAGAIDWKNQQPFTLASEELTARARDLFDAIAKDAPDLGESFWFPKEPFIPLKDVKGPGKYWDTLHASFVEDIHALHRKRKSWDGATFTSFTVGSTPKWVKPEEEANKIGYYRSFRGMIAFSQDGHAGEIEVHTIITWQGRWFVTHLRKVKH